MRKYLAGLASASCLFFAAAAIADQTQTIEGSLNKSKLPKRGKGKGVALRVVTTADDPEADTPLPARKAVIAFDGDLDFTTKGLKRCGARKIENATTESAIDLCKKSKVGAGKAEARLGTTKIPAVVTAFNGRPTVRKPTILLHSKPEGLPAVILTGILKERKKKSKLKVDIPALTGDAAITVFDVTVKERYRHKGKKRDYVRATCSDRKIRFKGTFAYSDGSRLTAKDKFGCKPKG